MATNVEIRGTVEQTIERAEERYVDDPAYRNARLNKFEELAGVSPKKAVAAIVRGAAEKCGVKGCELTAAVEDRVHEQHGFGTPPNEIDPYKERAVKATLTCPRSCSRQACQSVISGVTETVEKLFNEAKGGVVGPAQRAHIQPAEQRAAEIRAAADAEAGSILAAARDGLEATGTQAQVDFRERYNLPPPKAK